jgi:hypothetical protein
MLQRDELKKSFDLKIDEIINLVDGHIRRMHVKHPDVNIVCQISHLRTSHSGLSV